MSVIIGPIVTERPFGHEIKLAEMRCDCGNKFMGFMSSKDPVCGPCENERRHLREMEDERKRLAAWTLSTVPRHFLWARLGAPELMQRVSPASIIGKACEALGTCNVVLIGASGVGKTSLACALLREAAARREQVGRFVTTFELAEARRQNRLGNGEARAIIDAIRADILLLDELAAEQTRDSAVDEVIRCRHDRERPTIFTCGFSRDYVAEKYGAGVERRIFEGAVVLRLGGK